jgi:hypothetical protein
MPGREWTTGPRRRIVGRSAFELNRYRMMMIRP